MTSPNARSNQCVFWNCTVKVQRGHTFCYEHYQDALDGKIDQCPGCGRGKDSQYELCLDCRNPSRAQSARPQPGRVNANRGRYRTEYSPAWDKADSSANQFYVYMLKLDGGEFYAGQTRELRERLSEHRDGRVKSTQGRNPKLVWFGILPTREAAASTEVELKKLIDSNPREIRRMYLSFQDLARELDYT